MKQQLPLITVITSAYNAECTLENTIKSVCEQTYKNIEYIIIDHGSKDRTEAIIDIAKQKDKRIKKIKLKENRGYIGRALNEGIKIARGEYITFLDADDEYDVNYLQEMIQCARKKSYDIVMCGYCYVNEQKEIIRTVQLQSEIPLDSKQDYIRLWENMEDISFGYLYVWWNKLYKRSFLEQNKIHLPEDTYIHGDAIFNANILSYYPSIYCLSRPLVNWTCADGSVSHGTYKKGYYKEAVNSAVLYKNLIEDIVCDLELKKNLYRKLVLSISHLQRIRHYREDKREILEELKRWIQDDDYKMLVSLAGMEEFVKTFYTDFVKNIDTR